MRGGSKHRDVPLTMVYIKPFYIGSRDSLPLAHRRAKYQYLANDPWRISSIPTMIPKYHRFAAHYYRAVIWQAFHRRHIASLATFPRPSRLIHETMCFSHRSRSAGYNFEVSTNINHLSMEAKYFRFTHSATKSVSYRVYVIYEERVALLSICQEDVFVRHRSKVFTSNLVCNKQSRREAGVAALLNMSIFTWHGLQMFGGWSIKYALSPILWLCPFTSRRFSLSLGIARCGQNTSFPTCMLFGGSPAFFSVHPSSDADLHAILLVTEMLRVR